VSEPDTDKALGFTIPARNVRGRAVRLGAVVDEVLAAHDYPPALAKLLAEALVLAALLGTMLKDAGGQLTLQAQTESGAISLLVADYMAQGDGEAETGALRGYVQFDEEKLAMIGADPSLFGLFGKGYLAITFDQLAQDGGPGGRYQGIVPLEGASLAKAAEHYFAQSEQIPSFVQIDVTYSPAGWIAGGVLLQHLPDGEVGRERLHVRHDHPEWEHVQIIAKTLRADELTEAQLPLTDLVWRLFHEEDEVRATSRLRLTKGCRCDALHFRDVLSRFPAEERAEMADEHGNINVDCAFCSRIFPVSLAGFSN
jgi:molecular chaperone Hsp33